MLKEMRLMEYTLEVLRVLDGESAQQDTGKIYAKIEEGGRIQQTSKSYLAKVLNKMGHAGLLYSSTVGYTLRVGISNITVSDVLEVCDMPEPDSLLYSFCTNLQKATSDKLVAEFYDFSD